MASNPPPATLFIDTDTFGSYLSIQAMFSVPLRFMIIYLISMSADTMKSQRP